jgi:acetylornithine deacetylase/succinyl-diaminopimelate desuccinylase-like protein
VSAQANGPVELLQRLIRFDTVNPPGNERAAQEYLAERLGAAGFACELLGRTPERPTSSRASTAPRPGRAVPALARRHGAGDALGVVARPLVR